MAAMEDDGLESAAGSQGPSVVVDGVVFLRRKTCGLCGIQNTSPNEISGGSQMSKSSQPFTLWIRGSPTDPVNRHCKICGLCFQHGGFDEEVNGDIDVFTEKVRKNQELNTQFQGARVEMIRILSEGKLRFRGSGATKSKMRLSSARESALEEFRSSEQKIASNYRAILRSRFEELYPGRIERENLKTVTKMIEGAKREVVLIRKLPEGEWDLSLEERTGVQEREILDTNELQITPGQLKNKFDGRRQKLRAQVVEKGNSAAVLETETKRPRLEEAVDAAEASSSEEDEVAAGSVLEQEMMTTSRSARRAAPAVAAAAKANPSQRTTHNTNPVTTRTSVNTKQTQSANTVPAASQEDQEEDAKRRGRPNKFAGKNSLDVLDSHGLVQLRQALEKATLDCR
eukprot:s6436_g4.t1